MRIGMVIHDVPAHGDAPFAVAVRLARTAGLTGIEIATADPTRLPQLLAIVQSEHLDPLAIITDDMIPFDGHSTAAALQLGYAAQVAAQANAWLSVGVVRGPAPVAVVRPWLAGLLPGLLGALPQLRILMAANNASDGTWPQTLGASMRALAELGLSNHSRVRLLAATALLSDTGEMVDLEQHRAHIGHVHIAGRDHLPPPVLPTAERAPLAMALSFARRQGLDCSFVLNRAHADHAAACASWARSVLPGVLS